MGRLYKLKTLRGAIPLLLKGAFKFLTSFKYLATISPSSFVALYGN